MLKHIMVASVVVLGLTSPALAGTCQVMSKQVAAGLANSSLPAAAKAEIAKLREKGDEEHGEGKHDHALAEYTKALAMLGV